MSAAHQFFYVAKAAATANAAASSNNEFRTTSVNLLIYQLPGEHHHEPEGEVSDED